MKFGRFTQAAQAMVNEVLKVEDYVAAEEAQRTSTSVKVELPTLSMLTIFADMAGQSRYAFGGEILDDFVADLFWSLPEERRAVIAEKADALTNEFMAKQGMKVESIGPAGHIQGDQTWRAINSAATIQATTQKEAA